MSEKEMKGENEKELRKVKMNWKKLREKNKKKGRNKVGKEEFVIEIKKDKEELEVGWEVRNE